MPIGVNTGGSAEVMLIYTLETGRRVGVALHAGFNFFQLIGGCACLRRCQ